MFRFVQIISLFAALSLFLAGCTTNPATGEQQFTAFMSPSQEAHVGAQEHEKIAQLYGTGHIDPALLDYVNRIGQKVAQHTERNDVRYKFFVLDTPMVNAFALPGGFVYVSRGLVTQANSEAELAAVIAHEIAHITARHSAERYSHGVVSTLGAAVLSAALDDPTASRALGVGSELYIKSYSRSQEHQADELGIRYLHRAGYDPMAMSSFLTNLENYTALESRLAGKGQSAGFNYFSTHPRTADRINETIALAGHYQQGGVIGRDDYLRNIEGTVYGDSARQGFLRGDEFVHPEMGFAFYVPPSFHLNNQPSQIVATHPSGAVIVFDGAGNRNRADAVTFLTQIWMRGEPLSNVERIDINGMDAATASFPGRVNDRAVTVRIVAVEWSPQMFLRFQMAVPNGADDNLVNALKKVTYSLRRLSESEKRNLQPYRLDVVTAGAGDSAASLARRMPYDSLLETRFRVLNGLTADAAVQTGRLYKVVSD